MTTWKRERICAESVDAQPPAKKQCSEVSLISGHGKNITEQENGFMSWVLNCLDSDDESAKPDGDVVAAVSVSNISEQEGSRSLFSPDVQSLQRVLAEDVTSLEDSSRDDSVLSWAQEALLSSNQTAETAADGKEWCLEIFTTEAVCSHMEDFQPLPGQGAVLPSVASEGLGFLLEASDDQLGIPPTPGSSGTSLEVESARCPADVGLHIASQQEFLHGIGEHQVENALLDAYSDECNFSRSSNDAVSLLDLRPMSGGTHLLEGSI